MGSRNAHIFQAIVLGAMGVMALSFPLNFIPSLAYRRMFAWPIAAICTVLLIVTAIFLARNSRNSEKAKYYLSMVIIGSASFVFLARYSLPWVLHSAVGHESYELETTVDRLNQPRNSFVDGCRYQLAFGQFSDSLKGHICVDSSEFYGARIGSRYRITGEESWFGRTIVQAYSIKSDSPVTMPSGIRKWGISIVLGLLTICGVPLIMRGQSKLLKLEDDLNKILNEMPKEDRDS